MTVPSSSTSKGGQKKGKHRPRRSSIDASSQSNKQASFTSVTSTSVTATTSTTASGQSSEVSPRKGKKDAHLPNLVVSLREMQERSSRSLGSGQSDDDSSDGNNIDNSRSSIFNASLSSVGSAGQKIRYQSPTYRKDVISAKELAQRGKKSKTTNQMPAGESTEQRISWPSKKSKKAKSPSPRKKRKKVPDPPDHQETGPSDGFVKIAPNPRKRAAHVDMTTSSEDLSASDSQTSTTGMEKAAMAPALTQETAPVVAAKEPTTSRFRTIESSNSEKSLGASSCGAKSYNSNVAMPMRRPSIEEDDVCFDDQGTFGEIRCTGYNDEGSESHDRLAPLTVSSAGSTVQSETMSFAASYGSISLGGDASLSSGDSFQNLVNEPEYSRNLEDSIPNLEAPSSKSILKNRTESPSHWQRNRYFSSYNQSPAIATSKRSDASTAWSEQTDVSEEHMDLSVDSGEISINTYSGEESDTSLPSLPPPFHTSRASVHDDESASANSIFRYAAFDSSKSLETEQSNEETNNTRYNAASASKRKRLSEMAADRRKEKAERQGPRSAYDKDAPWYCGDEGEELNYNHDDDSLSDTSSVLPEFKKINRSPKQNITSFDTGAFKDQSLHFGDLTQPLQPIDSNKSNSLDASLSIGELDKSMSLGNLADESPKSAKSSRSKRSQRSSVQFLQMDQSMGSFKWSGLSDGDELLRSTRSTRSERMASRSQLMAEKKKSDSGHTYDEESQQSSSEVTDDSDLSDGSQKEDVGTFGVLDSEHFRRALVMGVIIFLIVDVILISLYVKRKNGTRN